MVTLDNAEEYVELMFDFCMHTGIQKQMEAFRGKTWTLCTSMPSFKLLLMSQMRVIWVWGPESTLLEKACFFVMLLLERNVELDTLLNLSGAEGFNRVFLMEKLSSFSHKEVQMILCGNQSPSWTAEDIVNYTEPKLGYTRDRCASCVSLGFYEKYLLLDKFI